jgi:hypothetical protein
MEAIAFSTKPRESSVVAGWAFRQILDQNAAQNPHDFEMAKQFGKAKAIRGLCVHKLQPDLAAKMTTAIKKVVTGILSGEIRSGDRGSPLRRRENRSRISKGITTTSGDHPSFGSHTDSS